MHDETESYLAAAGERSYGFTLLEVPYAVCSLFDLNIPPAQRLALNYSHRRNAHHCSVPLQSYADLTVCQALLVGDARIWQWASSKVQRIPISFQFDDAGKQIDIH